MSQAFDQDPEARIVWKICTAICSPAKYRTPGKWLFLGAFIFACFLFWWLPSLLYRAMVHQADPVDETTIALSFFALLLFIAGYLMPAARPAPSRFSESVLDACGDFSYQVTLLLGFPALALAVQFWYSHIGTVYGTSGIPFLYQVVLYTHLFFGFLFIGASNPEKQGWRRVLIVAALITLPRLIISMHYERFFLAQAIVPAVLIAVARGWMKLSFKRLLQLSALALAIIFVPALTRGDNLIQQRDIVSFFAAGSTLLLYQNNTDFDLSGHCSPLIVSLTAKTIPYGPLGICVMDFGYWKNMPATLDRILTVNDPSTFNGTVSGTGSNYLLDLYLFGGMLAVYAGSTLFGFTCRRFIDWIGRRSLFSGIWAECLTRALFAPRSSLGYVFERIPSLVLTTLLVVVIVWAWRLWQRDCAANFAHGGLDRA